MDHLFNLEASRPQESHWYDLWKVRWISPLESLQLHWWIFQICPSIHICWLVVWNILEPWNFMTLMLVGGLEPWNFMTFHSVENVIIPTDELIFFRGVGIPTTNQPYCWWIYPLKMVDLSIVMWQFTRGYVMLIYFLVDKLLWTIINHIITIVILISYVMLIYFPVDFPHRSWYVVTPSRRPGL